MGVALTPLSAAPSLPVPLPQPGDATAALVQALRSPACYPHPVEAVEVIETHISYVLLAGEFAYKLKKPVRLPFLDFSPPAARRYFCEEELRLNRRTAPRIYLDVVTIGGDAAFPRIGATPVLEYAVKMRRFDQGALFSALAGAGRLTPGNVDDLADAVAALHAGAARAPAVTGGERAGAALANFAEMAASVADPAIRARLEPLAAWTRDQARALANTFAGRADRGFERECHGDLHLANVVLVHGKPVLFDAIEFSPALRFIDVAADAAFVAMDLERHGLQRLAARFVDRYLARTGDYGALAVLRFYAVYRAMVRAKIAAIAFGQAPPGSERGRARAAELLDYVGLAGRLSRPGPGLVIAMHGLAASGKTTVAGRLVEALGAVRLRSDVERKRLHGLAAEARAGSAPGKGIYGVRDARATYDRLAAIARIAVAAGYPVIVDAAFLRRADRDRFRALAADLGAAFHVVSCTAPEAVLRERLAARAAEGRDASDADAAVLAHQLRRAEPLAPAEGARVLDTSEPTLEAALEAFAARVGAA